MLIDFETQRPIVCDCGEDQKLVIVQFVFGSKVVCETCGHDVT